MIKQIINRLNITIKGRIYLSFFLLVILFVISGVYTIITLNKNRKQADHISAITDPSLQGLKDFGDILIQSKMYTTNWVFLRSSKEDKDALKKLHDIDYPVLKKRLQSLSVHWNDQPTVDSMNVIFSRFEQLLGLEKRIMSLLKTFDDYDDPVLKLEAERIVEDEVLPRTAALWTMIDDFISTETRIREFRNITLQKATTQLTTMISILTVVIICMGIFLSLYMTHIIIIPVNQIRYIINDLGKGIIQKIDKKAKQNEIGKMIESVNNLSEKLQATANFAQEVGNYNFNMDFVPLSKNDTLSMSLINMRDKLSWGKKKLDEVHTEIQTIYDAVLDAVIIIDENGRIVKWDNKSEKLFGWTAAETINRQLSDLIIPETYRDAHKQGMKRFLKTGETRILNKTIEVRALKKNEEEFDISLSISSAFINSQYRFIGFIRDITSRKKAEAELLQSEADLALKNKELELKNKELEQFAYVASHDMQEPLRTTSSFVELLQRQYRGKLDDKADTYLTYIEQSSERMKVLIKDLLDYSRIGRKRELEEVDCNKLVQYVLADLDINIKETGAKIHCGRLPILNGYSTELKLLFQNLIINAIKFRKKEVAPDITINVCEWHDKWQISVSDNGIGIEEQYKERVFIIFQRLHTRNEYEGSGIGLAHCKKIVELHGGTIWIDTANGAGTTFHFTLPKINN